MAREFALDAELLAGADESGAEELLPEPIGDDAGGERVLGADEPLRERQAVGRTGGVSPQVLRSLLVPRPVG